MAVFFTNTKVKINIYLRYIHKVNSIVFSKSELQPLWGFSIFLKHLNLVCNECSCKSLINYSTRIEHCGVCLSFCLILISSLFLVSFLAMETNFFPLDIHFYSSSNKLINICLNIFHLNSSFTTKPKQIALTFLYKRVKWKNKKLQIFRSKPMLQQPLILLLLLKDNNISVSKSFI